MVWDVHGRILAREGARMLDLVPLFSEPLGRTFVGEQPMPTAFFFLNLFAHVALPIGFLLLLWVHVSRLARPTLLPPRRLLVALVGLLFAASVLVPAPLGPEGDAFLTPGRAPMDLFYSFWLPFAERVPAWSTLVVFGAGTLAVLLVPWLTRPRKTHAPAPSRVDDRLCTGCEQCYLDCPYEAISMVPRTDGRPTLVARVDESLCVSCGICAGSCAPMGVGPPGRTGRDQLAGVRAFVADRAPGSSDIVVVGCAQSGLAAGAPVDAPVFTVSCAGNLHTSVIEYLVRSGAGGVLVVSCPGRDCWNREGPKWLEERMYRDREAELKERVDRARVRLIHAGRSESSIVASEVARFRHDIALLDRTPAEPLVDLETECERKEVEA
jgi:ferredoxin